MIFPCRDFDYEESRGPCPGGPFPFENRYQSLGALACSASLGIGVGRGERPLFR